MRKPLRLTLLALALPCSALAGGSVSLSAGAAFPVTEPQRTYFSTGADLTGAFFWELLPFADVGALVDYTVLPGGPGLPVDLKAPAATLSFLAGARIKRPLEDARVVPWGQLGLGWVHTGTLNRFGLEGTAGVAFRLNETSPFLFGPMLRFLYVLSGPDEGFSSFNAGVLSAGISVELAFGNTPAAPPPAPEPPPTPPPAPPPPGPDSDHDGVRDAADLCPDQPGTAATNGCPDRDADGIADRLDACPATAGEAPEGCPRYQQIVVTDAKIELKQKVFFAFGTTTILPKSYPLLDEVMRALTDRPSICVRVEGHTDNVGDDTKNLMLSQGRAEAVRTYLSQHSIDPSRMQAKGYGSSLPLETNGTIEGREANRRVEFIIVSCGGGP